MNTVDMLATDYSQANSRHMEAAKVSPQELFLESEKFESLIKAVDKEIGINKAKDFHMNCFSDLLIIMRDVVDNIDELSDDEYLVFFCFFSGLEYANNDVRELYDALRTGNRNAMN